MAFKSSDQSSMEDKLRQPELSPKDRISQIPMELLLHLLTFLTRSETAPLKLLSRTWRKLLSATKLTFYCEEFNHFGEENLESYVGNILINREKMQVDKLEMIWLDEKSDAWVDYAVENNVKVLHVILREVKEAKLPESIRRCSSLEELAILSYPKLEFPTKTLTLNSLKNLILQALIISDESMDQIISGCPLLEELHFIICRLENSEIRSKSLKRLTIERCRVGFGFDYEEFCILTPNLEYLWYNALWQGLLCKKSVRANYIANITNKIFLKIWNLKTLTLGGLWLTRDCHAVSYFLSKASKLEQLMLLCNSPTLCPVPDSIIEFENHDFYCPDLEKITILGHETDTRVSWLYEILINNGLPYEIIETKFVINKDCFRAGMKMLETLHRVWGWVEEDMRRNFEKNSWKFMKIKMMNEKLRDLLDEVDQLDYSNFFLEDLVEDFLI